MSVLLVHPQTDEKIETYKLHHALGTISLATYLTSRGFQAESIRIIDFLDHSLEDMVSEASKNYDFVGVSANFFNYGNGLKILEAAKESGSRTILGGPHPTSCPELILQNRPFVDFCVSGKGELALEGLLRHENYEEIPSLSYRKCERIVTNPELQIDLNTLPIPRWDLLGNGIDELVRSLPETDIKRYLSFQGHAGCVWYEKRGCGFCSTPDRRFQGKSPERFWEEVAKLARQYKLDLLHDVGDCFTADKNWVRRLAFHKPKDSPRLFVYGKADEIDEKMANLLQYLNVFMVYIGFESGSDRMLRRATKGVSVRQLRDASTRLSNRGIKITGTFVLGMPGETQSTLSESMQLMEYLAENCDIYNVSANMIVPYHGTRFFSDFTQTPKGRSYSDRDLYSIKGIQRDFIESMTNVSPQQILDTVVQINTLGGRYGVQLTEKYDF